MRLRGFEPPRALAHRHLKTACLPGSTTAAGTQSLARVLGLQTDVFLHQRDAWSTVDPYVALVRTVLDSH